MADRTTKDETAAHEVPGWSNVAPDAPAAQGVKRTPGGERPSHELPGSGERPSQGLPGDPQRPSVEPV
jgi:hypothetical protein